ncbi:BTAD domain-containing putative transcriptional regulator [Streptomyces humidus]|uniref:AfsR/SARP family transcriptional regulator n=1 Tax=Streptomyces humidus TaxID=52259 RepID=UPI00167CE891|nr:BTAD domain-containing putative transcriptional regulator [Streptomyces humidus]
MPSFSVLGPMRAWCEGAELDLGPPQQRATLAVLLVRGKRPVPVGEIADVLWGERPPVSATNVIHRHIGMLRRVLEPGLSHRAQGQLLVRGYGGYRLRVGPDDVDLTRFRLLRERAQEAGLAQAAETAVDLFVEAAALWRGPVVAGIPAVARDHRLFTALDDEYAATVREGADTALRHGLADRVLPMLERCAARRPLDAGVHARLALALAATGHQAEALHVCHLARTRLAAEPGVTTGAELRSAHERVLAGHMSDGPVAVPPARPGPGHVVAASCREPGLLPGAPEARAAVASSRPAAAPTGGAGPAPQPGLPDDGRRLIFTGPTATAAAAATGPVPAATAELAPAAEPAPASGFVGRRAETAELLSLAAGASPEHEAPVLAAVCGQAGVGKTALAAQVARLLADRFPDGLIRVDLRGFDPDAAPVAPAEALRGLLRALDVPPHRLPEDPHDVDGHSAVWRSVLSGHRFLLLLDDARDAAQIRPLLPGTPGCMVLVTSRDQLSCLVAAEGAHRVVLDPMTSAESTELLAACLGPGRVTPDDAATARIVERCAGLPFALTAVAARITGAGVEPGAQAEAALGEAALGEARQRLHGSYRTLAPGPARLFRLLALHPGRGASTEEAAALAGLEPRRARALLSALTAVHLLDERAPGLFTLRPLEHAYARELLHRNESTQKRAAAVHRLSGRHLRPVRAAGVATSPPAAGRSSRPQLRTPSS